MKARFRESRLAAGSELTHPSFHLFLQCIMYVLMYVYRSSHCTAGFINDKMRIAREQIIEERMRIPLPATFARHETPLQWKVANAVGTDGISAAFFAASVVIA